MPRISIIVPVFNAEKYLDKCLNSIVNQTYQDIEVIIVNDGSTDDSHEVIDSYKEKYPDIINIFSKQNGGLSDARNFGIDKATGDYISFVDADDYLDLELYSKLQKEVETGIDLIKFKIIRVNDKCQEIDRIDGPIFEEKNGEDAFNTLVFKDKLLEPACIYLYKKESFTKNEFKFAKDKYHEDFGLIPLVIATADKVSSKNIYGYYYLQTDNSITRNEDYEKTYKSTIDLLFHYDNMVKQIAKFDLHQETICNLKQYYTNAILSSVKKLNKEDKEKYILEIKKRKLIKNIRCKNIKLILKKLIMKLSFKLYIKIDQLIDLTIK